MLSSGKSSAFSSYDPYFESRVALLQGDGTSGGRNNNFVDVSGTSKIVTQTACGIGSFSPYHTDGWGYAFSGSTWVEFQNASRLVFGTNAFTIEGFVWLTNGSYEGQTRTSACLVAKGTASVFWQLNLISGGTMNYPSFSWSSDVGAGISFILVDFPNDITQGSNRFVHFAVCRDSSGNMSFCLDGTVISSGTDTKNFTETNPLTIGNNPAHTLGLKGFISGLRIINGTNLYSGASSSTYVVPTYPLSATAETTATGSKIKLNEIALLTAQSKNFEDLSIYKTPASLSSTGSAEIRRMQPQTLRHKKYNINTLGTGIAFGGVSSALSCTASADFQIASSTAFTVEAWIYSRNVTAAANFGIVGYNNIVIAAGAGGWILTQAAAAGSISFIVYDANITILSSITSPTNSIRAYCWNHIAVSYDGTTAVMYINGKAVGSTSLTNTTYTGAVLYVGRWNYTTPRYFDGYIADVHIAKGTAKYTSNFTPPTSPVTAIANSKLLINGLNAGILDETGKNVAVPTGTPTISTNFKKNGTGSIAFNGTTDYLSFPTSVTNALGRDDFTVEGWYYIKTQTTNSTLFEIGTMNNAGSLGVFWTSGSGLYVRLSGTNDSITGLNDTPPLNQWVHIAVVRATVAGITTIKIYYNGVERSWSRKSNPYPEITATNVNIGWSASTNVFLNGFIDDFRISRRAEYTRNFTPPGRFYNY